MADSSSDPLRPLRAAGAVFVLFGLLAATLLLGQGLASFPVIVQEERWVYLSDLPWERASTEWLMVGKEGIPSVDTSFYTGAVLTLDGQAYAKGFGTHAPSEIVYQLQGSYSRLEALAGVEDDGLPGVARAQFLVFLDGVKAYESPSLGKDQAPAGVSLPLVGVDELKLVAIRTQDSTRGAQVGWVDVRVLASPTALSADDWRLLQRLDAERAALAERRAGQASELANWARRTLAILEGRLGSAFPTANDPPAIVEDPSQGLLALVNNRLAVTIGVGPERAGQTTLSVIDVSSQRTVASSLSPSIQVGQSESIELMAAPKALLWAQTRVEDIQDQVLGAGKRLTVPFGAFEGGERHALKLSLFRDKAVLLYQLEASPSLAAEGDLSFGYFGESSQGGLNVGERPQYLVDFVRLRHVVATDDGQLRRSPVSWGAPVYLWDGEQGTGLLFAALEETVLPPLFTMRAAPGRVVAQVGFAAQAARTDAARESGLLSPLLYFEVIQGGTMQDQFATYRALIRERYPPPDLPAWFRYQWLSWYVYYMDINEGELVRQIDLIVEHFGDLGPWHIIVDAGWYVAEGRPGAEFRQQDFEKFPRGLRWLVEYAHSKGIYVVLYFTAPYLENRQSAGSWLGLSGMVEDHPEWLISLDEGPSGENYVYNLQHPELRAYLTEVMRDFFMQYRVDGIKLDGLGSSGEAVLYTADGAAFGLSAKSLEQTLEVYRLVYQQAMLYNPDAYVESGWITPPLANSLSHTFRYGDEEPLFTRPYPLPGLIEHIDYAAYQQGLLGQRANMGSIYGDPSHFGDVHKWWLGAALALGAQVSISVDMGSLGGEIMSSYRSYLARYRPFEGTMRVDNALQQQVFSTQVDDVWYVGLMNREQGPRRFTVTAADLGLPPDTPFAAYDVERGDLITTEDAFTTTLESESFRLFVLRLQPGTLWSNSATREVLEDGRLMVAVNAPPTVPGSLHLYVPPPDAIIWDEEELSSTEDAFEESLGYSYDPDTSLLTLWYPSGGRHTLRIDY